MKREKILLWAERGLLCVLVILAVKVRLPFMGRGFFYDEIFVFNKYIVSQDFLGIFRDFWPTNHLAYTALAWCSYHLSAGAGGGTPEWSTRLPALFFGIAGILIFWLFVRQYWGRAVALLAVLLLCLSPTHAIFSASARGNSALIFFSILASWAYFNFLERPPSRRLLAGFVLMNVLALAFHGFFVFIVLAQALHLGYLSFPRKVPKTGSPVVGPATIRRIAMAIGLSIVCAGLVYWPLVLPALRAFEPLNSWTPLFPLFVFSQLLSIDSPWIFLGIAGVMVVGLLFSGHRSGGPFRTYFLFIFASVFLLWLVHAPTCFSRYYSYALPFLLILLAAGLVNGARYSRGVFKALFSVLVAGSLALLIWSWEAQPSFMVKDNENSFKIAAEYAKRVFGPDARYCTNGSPEIFSYYCARKVATFKTAKDFSSFYREGGDLVYFYMPSLGVDEEGAKIIYLLSKTSVAVLFYDINVFFLKGPPVNVKKGAAASDQPQGRQ
jgi:hypothetical protein